MKYLATLVFSIFIFNSYSQSIARNWHSEKEQFCIVLDSVTKCARVNEFYSDNPCKRIKYSVEEGVLKMTWKSGQRPFFFGWMKEYYEFKIEKLTQDSLTLILLQDGWNGRYEAGMLREDFISSDTIHFVSTNLENCRFGKYSPVPIEN